MGTYSVPASRGNPSPRSVRAQIGDRGDGVTAIAPVRERYPDFSHFLPDEADAEMLRRLPGAENHRRPLGNRKSSTRSSGRQRAFSTRLSATEFGAVDMPVLCRPQVQIVSLSRSRQSTGAAAAFAPVVCNSGAASRQAGQSQSDVIVSVIEDSRTLKLTWENRRD